MITTKPRRIIGNLYAILRLFTNSIDREFFKRAHTTMQIVTR